MRGREQKSVCGGESGSNGLAPIRVIMNKLNGHRIGYKNATTAVG